VVGRLTLEADGRPIDVRADGETVLVTLPGLRTAWRLRRSHGAAELLATLRRMLARLAGHRPGRPIVTPVRMRIGRSPALTILPRPGLLARLLLGPASS